MKAAALHRAERDMIGELPFARQSSDVPVLSDPDAFPKLLAIVEETKAGLLERFPDTQLVLIVVDTLASAAAFQDENSASETQKVMTTLRRLSDASGALVLAVDHHGKATETGVRGSSAKSGAADAIIAALADKSMEGDISNRRLAIVKLRSGVTGKTIPFSLKPIKVDVWGNTSCAIEWQETEPSQASGAKQPKPAWSGNARVFKAAMLHAMIEHGEKKRPFVEKPEFRTVELSRVRLEFYARYPADTQEAKKKAFSRQLVDVTGKGLIASREIDGVDWLWFLKETDTIESQMTANKRDTEGDRRDNP